MPHTSNGNAIDYVAIAILRRDDQLVMVRQHVPDSGQPYWVLPGGLVEAGELVHQALIREVKEEAGVTVTAIGPLAVLSQIDRPAHAGQTLAFTFEVSHWQGELQVQDPDGEVSGVELVPQAEAIARMARSNGWAGVREPLLAYLRGQAEAGTMWFYRETENGQGLISALPQR